LEDLTSISFGALAKAQESLGSLKRRRGEDRGSTSIPTKKPRLFPDTAGAFRVTESGINGEQRDDGRNKKSKLRKLSRSSKHAPVEQSSKRPVSRRRDVISAAKLQRRDPRFEPLGGPGGRVDDERTKKNYAFLDTYRESEMAELRTAIRNSNDEQAKAEWKRALLVMESRKKAQEAKERRQGVVRAHRAREKELVKQGKKPFYLKKAELQRRALVERFEGMGEKQVDKVIERRRKKTAATERRRIPEGRRVSTR
jgi:ribosomal RNA-processing protein 36